MSGSGSQRPLQTLLVSYRPLAHFKIAPCDPNHDARRQALGAAHLVRGPVRLIHHKNLKHPHTLCKLVNAAASATRVVVGATACAMHDLDRIDVHELRDGSPWLD